MNMTSSNSLANESFAVRGEESDDAVEMIEALCF